MAAIRTRTGRNFPIVWVHFCHLSLHTESQAHTSKRKRHELTGPGRPADTTLKNLTSGRHLAHCRQMASLTRQRQPAALGRGPWERCAARCAVKTRPRQATRGLTDDSIRMLPEQKADGAFAGGGVGLLLTGTAAIVETDSVGGVAREYRRGRAINRLLRLNAVRNL